MARGVRLRRIKRIVKASGETYCYYRRRDGKLIPLPRLPENDPIFAAAWSAAALADGDGPDPRRRPARSLGELAARYQASREFSELAQATQESRRYLIKSIISREAGGLRIEDMPVSAVSGKTISRDLAERSPQAGRNRLKCWRSLFKFARAIGWREDDPARLVEAPRAKKSQPHRRWTAGDVAAFRARWPLGTQQRAAMEVLYDHAPRRADLVTLSRRHVSGGTISWRQSKTGDFTTPRPLGANAAAAINALIAARPNIFTFLETEQGRPRSAKSFGEWFREAVRAAGLDGLSAHGFRHTLASDAAEGGASGMAIGPGLLGHRTEAEARTYVQQAERSRLANLGGDALLKTRDFGNRRKPKMETKK